MKDRKTYKILTFCSFILPINRWYLGNAKGAFWRSVLANYFFLGWIGYMLYMDKTFMRLWQNEVLRIQVYVTSRGVR